MTLKTNPLSRSLAVTVFLGFAGSALAQSQPDPSMEAGETETAASVSQQGSGPDYDGGNFMDVRLNLTLTNENVLVEPGDTIPNVPGWRFGRPSSLGVLFFDNYDTRFSGYETLSHLVLYKHHDSGHHEVEGGLVLRINNLAQNRINLSDAGTYLRYAYWFDKERKSPERISVTGFPTSSDRFRLGYSFRLSWGGSNVYRRSDSEKPGIKIQYDGRNGYAFVGAKSSVLLDNGKGKGEQVSVMGFLAGGGYDLTDMLRVEANLGIFDRGNNELSQYLNEKVLLVGASTQVSLHKGAPIGRSVDFALYRNDPERIRELFRRPVWESGTSWQIAAEATVIGQTLKDPEVDGGTTVQLGYAGDINARLRTGNFRYRLDLQARNAAFILHPTPSLPTVSYTHLTLPTKA